MVYVLNENGEPLMPTNRHGKVRGLLTGGRAKVVKVKPFTIQLLYTSTKYTQDITLGVDSGYLNIGFSAIGNSKEFVSGEVKFLQGQKLRLIEKARYRRQRRKRLRYRTPRFNNRTGANKIDWLAPSIKHKLDSHIRFIENLRKLLPITKINVEVANFDIQKMKDNDIAGVDYQNGDMKGFWNLREYVLHRDNHKCTNANCKNKSETPILQIHHIVFRSNGGTDSSKNLTTLCNKCHTTANHKKGKLLHNWMIDGFKVKQFKDSTFMSMVRWRIINYLKSLDIDTSYTYGYETKSSRISQELEKTHYNDAFCIANGTTEVLRLEEPYIIKQRRRNNRSLESFYDSKYIDIRTGKKVSGKDLPSGRTTRNKSKNGENLRVYRGKKLSKGRRNIRRSRCSYRPGDLIKYENKIYSVCGAQNNGAYVKLNGIEKVPSVKNIIPYRYSAGLTF
ncbi:MAG: RNA-guided endonuclease IscB [Sarcina sp.]